MTIGRPTRHITARSSAGYRLLGALLVLLTGCFCAGTHAALNPTLTLDPDFERADLTPHLRLLEDPQGQWHIRDLLSGRLDGQFEPPGGSGSNLSFTRSTWWVTFTLANPGPREQRILIRQAYPLIDDIEFWQESPEGHWQVQRTGDRRPFAERPLPHHNFLFPVTLEPGSHRTFYMRFQSEGAMDISLAAFTPNRLLREAGMEQLGYGVYYGGVLVLVVYNLFIFIAVRDKAFLYYLLYIFCLGLYMSNNDGLFFQFISPGNPAFSHNSLLVLLGLSLMFAVHFARHILTIPQFSRSLDIAGRATAWALALTTLGSFVLPYSGIIVTLSLLTLWVMPLIFAMGVARFCSRYPPARYFLLAWTAFIFGTMVYMTKVFGILPRNFFTENGFQVASLVEIVLLSLALGSRVSELRKQSDTDMLTTMFNRRAFDTSLQREFRRSTKTGQPLSLLMIDIDHFKQFNDTYGHSLGDQVLKAVGEELRLLIRKPMIPCRFGGEEFAVILPRTDAKQAMVLAERVCHHLAKKHLAKHTITVSIGVASLYQAPFSQPAQFLRAADTALYTAKAAGRNRVALYHPGTDIPSRDLITAEAS